MADVDCVVQVKLLHQGREIVSICTHVVSFPLLARSPMTSPIVRNAAKTAVGKEDHLVFPRISIKRPAMAEDNGLSRAPVFVIDLGTVFCRNRWHIVLLRG